MSGNDLEIKENERFFMEGIHVDKAEISEKHWWTWQILSFKYNYEILLFVDCECEHDDKIEKFQLGGIDEGWTVKMITMSLDWSPDIKEYLRKSISFSKETALVLI